MKINFKEIEWLLAGLTLFFLVTGGIGTVVSGWFFFQPLPVALKIQNSINLGMMAGFVILGLDLLRLLIRDIRENLR